MFFRKRNLTLDFLTTPRGRIVISIIMGFGFATLFRESCKNNSCLIIKGPKQEQLKKYYKIDKKCYSYNPYSINCQKTNTNPISV